MMPSTWTLVGTLVGFVSFRGYFFCGAEKQDQHWFKSATRQEADHTKDDSWSRPLAAVAFREWLDDESDDSVDLENDFPLHHATVERWCRSRSRRECTWKEYYDALDEIRTPFANLFDPGAVLGVEVPALDSKLIQSTAHFPACTRVGKITSKEFLELIKASKPVIISSAGVKNWEAMHWTFEHLLRAAGDQQVVASASPTGAFDSPESPALWGLNSTSVPVIARPGHIMLTMEKFISLLNKKRSSPAKGVSNSTASLYLEYFPLQKLGANLLDQLGPLHFANFLAPRHRLLWMGGDKTVGSLHYDRHENLMVMLRGSKTFTLIDPSQSGNVYGGSPVRFANVHASLNGKSFETAYLHYHHATFKQNTPFFLNAGDLIALSRNLSSLTPVEEGVHVYSPVSLKYPDLNKFPKSAEISSVECKVNEGEILYTPAEWWHEVESFADDEGKAIGVNIFFEPYYVKRGYISDSKVLMHNRYYHHLSPGPGGDVSALPCSKMNVCFVVSASKGKRKLVAGGPAEFQSATQQSPYSQHNKNEL